MTYDECEKLSGSTVSFYKDINGVMYYGCTPTSTSPMIRGAKVPVGSTVSNNKIMCEADGQHRWVVGTDGVGRCLPMTSIIPSTVLNGLVVPTSDYGVTMTPNVHGNVTVNYPANPITGVTPAAHGLAFIGGTTVSYPLSTPSSPSMSPTINTGGISNV